ncbi:hypothetical protein DYD21_02230 [Rhodohalobacter sp. SW132]|uniref:plastocyanin/azurin family copper-binding protein n=1 Tax=Rhodohalobacter sp. SW132 TaxID=2293433 RepID=UPI000E27F93F|nr:plastocyanin/azurin family copper-binding protein [Rhodohalobacter sp. SW132]REL38791.1 hypothetical protein DYD21_02230 [Rhodohalobacter sp. SW132]
MKNVILSSLLLSMVFLLVACGGEDTTEQAQETAAADDGVRTIEVIGTDDMRFVVAEAQDGLVTGGAAGQYIQLESIEASPGEEIRITLRTVSNLPASAMSHNLAVLTLDADTEAFARASLQARDNDYIAPEYEDWVIATTAMLGDGESDTITFTVPDETGEYDYICTFPGHFSGGMVGTLIVN